MKITLKESLYKVLIFDESNGRIHRYFNLGMVILISLNVIAVILETEQSIYQRNKPFFDVFEFVSVLIFTVEYILRLWVCTLDERYKNKLSGRIRFAIQPLQLIDLLSFLPFYLPFVGVDLRFIRVIRLFRLFRLLKMGRYNQSLITLGKVIKSKREELSITLFAGFIGLIVSSILMYFVEHNAQPNVFGSIIDGMWWGVTTLTTVGYGDAIPITPLGKILGSLISILGIGLFALPAGIISSGFITEIQKSKNSKICPHCGKTIE